MKNGTLEAVRLEIAFRQFVFHLFIKVVNPSKLTLEEGNLETFFVVILVSINFKTLVNRVYAVRKIMDGYFHYTGGWPSSLTEYFNIEIYINISLSQDLVDSPLVFLMDIVLVDESFDAFGEFYTTTTFLKDNYLSFKLSINS